MVALGAPLLSVTEWCASAPLLAVVLSQGCSALPRSVSCSWLASADCAMDACSACVLGKLVSRMSLPSRPQSCFPSMLLAISVAFKMPAPGQALGEMCANHALSFCASRGSPERGCCLYHVLLLPDDTLLLVSSAAFGMCEVTVMLSCEDSASSGAAAVGTDAVFRAPFVTEVSTWAPSSPGGVTAPAGLDSST